tara:strand:- start:253 stop:366 length:114 start_codon:yes stop_codon:yes gene_type:complete
MNADITKKPKSYGRAKKKEEKGRVSNSESNEIDHQTR